MGQILIRRLDAKALRRLKKRAEEQGLSLEESLRRVLAAEAAKPTKAAPFALRHQIARVACWSHAAVSASTRGVRASRTRAW